MKSFEEFKERFENGEYDDLVASASNIDEFIDVVRGLGYDIGPEDIGNMELTEDQLELVAGGKPNNKSAAPQNVINVSHKVEGDHNIYLAGGGM